MHAFSIFRTFPSFQGKRRVYRILLFYLHVCINIKQTFGWCLQGARQQLICLHLTLSLVFSSVTATLCISSFTTFISLLCGLPLCQLHLQRPSMLVSLPCMTQILLPLVFLGSDVLTRDCCMYLNLCALLQSK